MNLPGFVEVTTTHPLSKMDSKMSLEISTIDSFGPTSNNSRTVVYCSNDIHLEIHEKYEEFKKLLYTALTGEETTEDE